MSVCQDSASRDHESRSHASSRSAGLPWDLQALKEGVSKDKSKLVSKRTLLGVCFSKALNLPQLLEVSQKAASKTKQNIPVVGSKGVLNEGRPSVGRILLMERQIAAFLEKNPSYLKKLGKTTWDERPLGEQVDICSDLDPVHKQRIVAVISANQKACQAKSDGELPLIDRKSRRLNYSHT